LARSGITDNNFFEVSFGGAALLTLNNWPASPYTVFSFDGLIASGASTVLSFTFRNNPNYFLLDDVRLTVVDGGGGGGVIPEPATWAMLIAGFGLVGGALRRRRTALQA
ncbi:MAG: PEPxxWA-CTERM sorting domain-containing protein, partial [Thermaurantiacus sp.]